ncbi:protein NYNRIN-like isoform X1 [Microtus ochrogaster]|uniref:Protein NYNRIN-like isoform X1 n=1 Tax=Microtus ochrogaster TaxID=79684 RepID=A0ABM1TTT4_MICOH|nr:protein NYNRIN-like isoform X1 [Microtus ochrogaster]
MCAHANPQGALHIRQSLHQLCRAKIGRLISPICLLIKKKLHYLLTLVDTSTGWIEAFPASRETADVVAQILLDHVIPRFGIPPTIQMDNGPAFTSRVMELVSEALNVSWKFHIPYYPQPSGKVERPNGLIKQQLIKLSIELRLSWPSLPPIALTCLRATPHSPTCLSPFKLLYGRPFFLNHHLPAHTPPLVGYLPYLSLLRSLLHSHADSCLSVPTPVDTNAPKPALLSTGDEVFLKQLTPRFLEPRWTGPHTVILRSWNPLPPLRVSTGHPQTPSSQHKGHLLPGVASWAWTLPLD